MSRSRILAWEAEGLSLELRDNPGEALTRLPEHSHAEYQIVIGQYMATRYSYRGARFVAPPGSIVVLHPSEAHSAAGLSDAQPSAPLRTMLVPQQILESAMWQARSPSAGRGSLPYFAEPVIVEPGTVRLLLHLHQTLQQRASTRLEREEAVLAALARLCAMHAEQNAEMPHRLRERSAVRRVRRYLDDQPHLNSSLAELAEVAGFSPYYLCRVFSHEVGLTPHVYKTQMRLQRAKRLLLAGETPLAEIALQLGYADQSHFTREFKKSVGVTPARYRPYR